MGTYLSEVTSAMRYAKDFAIAAGAYALASKRHKSMPSLTPLDSVAQLSPLVVRILGQNPGPFTLQGTNTYLIGSGQQRILIDTGEPNIEKYLAELKKSLNGSTISSIIITHWHHDHVGGLPSIVKNIIGHSVPVYKIRRENINDDHSLFEYVKDGHKVSVEGATVRFVQTPGHTVDHASLWLEEEQALFSGDCILGEGTTVFEDLHDYMNSLEKIKGLQPKRIYPGHGPVINDVPAKVEEYIFHRMKREVEVIEVLKEANGNISSMDITNKVYTDSPMAVRLAALNNVRLHLNKLIKDGRVLKSGLEMYSLTEQGKL